MSPEALCSARPPRAQRPGRGAPQFCQWRPRRTQQEAVSLSGFAHLSRRTLDGKGGASARREARPRSGLRTVRAVPRSPPSRRQARPQHSLRGLAVGIKGNETCVPLRDDGRAHVAVTAVAIPGDRGPRGLAPVTGRGAEARPPHEQTRDQAPPHSQP